MTLMITASASSDSTMEAIGQAVTEGQAGDVAAARQKLLDLWSTIGAAGDPLHRCSLAHYLADLHEDPHWSWSGTFGPWTLPTL